MNPTKKETKIQQYEPICSCGFAIPHEAMECPSCGNPRPFERFGCAKRWVFQHPDLSAPAKSLYGLLASFANYKNGCLDMSIAAMARHAAMSRSAVNRAVKQLQEAGAMRRISGHREWGRWWIALGHLDSKVPVMALNKAKSVSLVAHHTDYINPDKKALPGEALPLTRITTKAGGAATGNGNL